MKNRKNSNALFPLAFTKGEVPFGQTQAPKLNDYADGMDTMQFVLNLKSLDFTESSA